MNAGCTSLEPTPALGSSASADDTKCSATVSSPSSSESSPATMALAMTTTTSTATATATATATSTATTQTSLTTLTAKYGKQTISIPDLPTEDTTIFTVKQLILQKTNILPKRQKFIGLAIHHDSVTGDNKSSETTTKRRKKTTVIDSNVDDYTLDKLQIKKPKECIYNSNGELLHIHHSFILMGTPEAEIFIDPDANAIDNTNIVVNDFDLDFNIGSSEWKEHFVNRQNLIKFTNSTQVHIMNQPREGKKLMVLDLDHTLLDFDSKKIVNSGMAARNGDGIGIGDINDDDTAAAVINPPATAAGTNVQQTINQMKRPFMDEFLTEMYKYYDLVVWSQTSWRWLETKLIELGMVTHPNYRFCFVLDKTSMFAITSTKRTGEKIKHYVKPLQIIWTKFPKIWNASNTMHLDDLSRNFALNLENGLKVSAYYRKKKKNGRSSTSARSTYTSYGNKDVELLGLIGYCTQLAKEVNDFRDVDFKDWKNVVNGTTDFIVKKKQG